MCAHAMPCVALLLTNCRYCALSCCLLQDILRDVYSRGLYEPVPLQPGFTTHGVTPDKMYLLTPDIMVDILKGVSEGSITSHLPAETALDAFGRDTYRVGDQVEILMDADDGLGDEDDDVQQSADPPDFQPLVVLATGVIVDASPVSDTVSKAFKVRRRCAHGRWILQQA